MDTAAIAQGSEKIERAKTTPLGSKQGSATERGGDLTGYDHHGEDTDASEGDGTTMSDCILGDQGAEIECGIMASRLGIFGRSNTHGDFFDFVWLQNKICRIERKPAAGIKGIFGLCVDTLRGQKCAGTTFDGQGEIGIVLDRNGGSRSLV